MRKIQTKYLLLVVLCLLSSNSFCSSCNVADCKKCRLGEPNQCSTCSQGHFLKKSLTGEDKCDDCIENCLRCKNETQCTECKTYYDLSSDKTECVKNQVQFWVFTLLGVWCILAFFLVPFLISLAIIKKKSGKIWVNIRNKKELKTRFSWCLVFGCEFLLTFLKIFVLFIVVVICAIILAMGGCVILIIILICSSRRPEEQRTRLVFVPARIYPTW